MEAENKDSIFHSRGCAHSPKLYHKNEHLYKKGFCKLDVYDWLKDIKLPPEQPVFNYAEVRFKNNNKDFFNWHPELDLRQGDIVAVESKIGHDIGIVTLLGETVRLQMKKKEVSPRDPGIRMIYRKARLSDIEKWIESVEAELPTLKKVKKLAMDQNLVMKFNDIEYQGDNTRAVFYYTADDRVDFRGLLKVFHEVFKVKVEMKQIGARQEAARLGGIGVCGRELCCSSWMTDYKSVSTNAARIQQLSMNQQKLAGQCSKLKCCLNYEYEVYTDLMKNFPDTRIKLKTKKGEAFCQNTDVLKEIIWYSYASDTSTMMAVPVVNVKKIMAMNQAGEIPEKLEDFAVTQEKKIDYDKNDDPSGLKNIDNM